MIPHTNDLDIKNLMSRNDISTRYQPIYKEGSGIWYRWDFRDCKFGIAKDLGIENLVSQRYQNQDMNMSACINPHLDNTTKLNVRDTHLQYLNHHGGGGWGATRNVQYAWCLQVNYIY